VPKVRTVWMNARNWNIFNYIFFFYDQAGIFKHCVPDEVLSYLQRADPRLNVTLSECEDYLNFVYVKAALWEAT